LGRHTTPKVIVEKAHTTPKVIVEKTHTAPKFWLGEGTHVTKVIVEKAPKLSLGEGTMALTPFCLPKVDQIFMT
jgi:hypothetical protein